MNTLKKTTPLFLLTTLSAIILSALISSCSFGATEPFDYDFSCQFIITEEPL